MNLYHETLLDHYRHPRYKGTLSSPTLTLTKHNPSCGDSIMWYGSLGTDGKFEALLFQGSGCVISQATASMLAEKFQGASVATVCSFTTPELLALIGVQLGPNRLQCALLPLLALQEGVCSTAPNC